MEVEVDVEDFASSFLCYDVDTKIQFLHAKTSTVLKHVEASCMFVTNFQAFLGINSFFITL